MRNSTKILLGVILLVALAAPAFAMYRVISDRFDRESGIGTAVIQLDPTLFMEVRYRDMDSTMSFTPRDQRLHVRYTRRAAGGVVPLGAAE